MYTFEEFRDHPMFTFLTKENRNSSCRLYSDGNMILCETEKDANLIANFLELVCGYACIVTGYYDPKEDEKSGCVDEYTGLWYVDIT